MLALIFALALASTPPDLSGDLGPALARSRDFAARQGEALWPGYGTAPFGFLLVTKSSETLLCQPSAPAGFTALSNEPATGCRRWTRPPSGLPDNLLAAMPVFGPPSTIVMGTPTSTGRNQGDWTRTILHEHFHQYQSALPDYFARALALGLAPPGDSGMWMLNFPFPYADPAAGAAYAKASVALADALDARSAPLSLRGQNSPFLAAFDRYLAARNAFAAAVGERNWRYIDFQLWQEGVARWTETVLGAEYPDRAVREEAASLQNRTLAKLRTPDLKAQGRELAYPMGAGEAMLMESCSSVWRARYPTVLANGPLLAIARQACASVR